MKYFVVALLGITGMLWHMLYLAEKDAAYWHSEAQEVPLLRETTRIQGIALQNYCKPIRVREVKLASPIGRTK